MQVAFDAALAALDPPPPFAVAVSGGPDSTALMRLAAPLKPVVLTVDHGLRAEAAGEAQAVAAWARELGLVHETLVWRGEKPAAGLQAAAREARYRLLGEACLRRGVASLMTGHTLDDQIETVAMRLEKGSGKLGAAGMPAQTWLPGTGGRVRLVRPLLMTRKAALVAWLEAQGQAFFTDPSNSDPRFDRARLRQAGASVDPARIAEAQAERVALERAVLDFLSAEIGAGPPWLVVRAAWRAVPHAVADLALTTLLRRVGGRPYPGTRPERARLLAAIRAEGVFQGRTLGGCILRRATRAERRGDAEALAMLPETAGTAPAAMWWLPFASFLQLGAQSSGDGTLKGRTS